MKLFYLIEYLSRIIIPQVNGGPNIALGLLLIAALPSLSV